VYQQLPITCQSIQQPGGRITVESNVSQRATFALRAWMAA
jgi:hypothetical protein